MIFLGNLILALIISIIASIAWIFLLYLVANQTYARYYFSAGSVSIIFIGVIFFSINTFLLSGIVSVKKEVNKLEKKISVIGDVSSMISGEELNSTLIKLQEYLPMEIPLSASDMTEVSMQSSLSSISYMIHSQLNKKILWRIIWLSGITIICCGGIYIDAKKKERTSSSSYRYPYPDYN